MNTFNKSFKKSILAGLFVAIVFIFPCSTSYAAELFFGTSAREVGIGQVYEVGVFVNTGGEQLNAFEGEIVFPPESVEFVGIRDGNSIISMWVEYPHLSDTSSGRIIFSGISPGGYRGEQGYFFSVLFRIIKPGEITIASVGEHMLLNDGLGTEVALSRAPLTLRATDTTSTVGSFLSPYDTEPPESFIPTIARSVDLFNNRYFVAFTAQDKGSGISHYEIAEERYFPWNRFISRDPVYVSGKSPYELRDQTLRSVVFVKAIDNAGNEQVISIAPTGIPWYEKYMFWCILALIILLVPILLIRLYGGKKKNH